MMSLLQKTIWRVLGGKNYHSGAHLKELKSGFLKDTYIPHSHSVVHNSQKVNETQSNPIDSNPPTDEWVNKMWFVQKLLLGFKKE